MYVKIPEPDSAMASNVQPIADVLRARSERNVPKAERSEQLLARWVQLFSAASGRVWLENWIASAEVGAPVLCMEYTDHVLLSEYKECTMTRLQLRIREEFRNRIEDQATRTGVTLSDYVVAAVAEKLERDAETANRIQLSEESRAWFFEVLEDTSPLPEAWAEAKKLAEEIKG